LSITVLGVEHLYHRTEDAEHNQAFVRAGGGDLNLTASIHIDCPAAAVSAYVMDVTNDSEWRTGVVDAAFTSGTPIGVGSTGFDRIEANGREMVSTWTIFEYEPGLHARWTLDSGPIRGSGGYVCDPVVPARFSLSKRKSSRLGGIGCSAPSSEGWAGNRTAPMFRSSRRYSWALHERPSEYTTFAIA